MTRKTACGVMALTILLPAVMAVPAQSQPGGIQPADVYVRSAKIALKANPPNYNRARTNLAKCLEHYPGYFEAHVVQGFIHGDFDDIDSMLYEFELAQSTATPKQWKKVAKRIKDIRESKWMKFFNKGVSEIRLSDSLNQLRFDESDSAALAKLNRQVDGVRDQAMESFQFCVNLQPDEFWAYMNCGIVDRRAGRIESALNWFREAENLFHKMELKDSTSDFYDTTLFYQEQGKDTDFLKDFRKKFKKLSRKEYADQYRVLLKVLAESYLDRQQTAEALAAYKRFLIFEPEDIPTLVAMLNIYESLGLIEEAESLLGMVEGEADPDVIYNLALFYYNAGRSANDSILAYEKILRTDPHDQVAMDRVSKFDEDRQKKFGHAAERFAQVVEHNPKDFEAWYRLGLCHYSTGKNDDAATALATAWDGDETNRKQICPIMRRMYAKALNQEKLEEWTKKCGE